ncbi:uroporphyrinogen-III synthase [Psychrobacillus glaciei]|uniref:Uroporphyrinogen-III synthase n=1 Tax=Psychrobacillus glaciei TaxID=2283160 RepID=A0A5J6SNN8_9BACI|nr:uroporphyrinogen-III synthase [Psychrobacillus glaciei]QFF99586.1 uroporphyrinogen-III synthase [Psychrobacillus glaciei]
MSNKPLLGENVLFTGILRSSEAVDLTLHFGGNPIVAPLIETQEIVSQTDEQQLFECKAYDWLIFTSQSSVDAFHSKMIKYGLDPFVFQGKIAVVGSKTAYAVNKIGLKVTFTPSIFSADVFVQEFPAISSSNEKCMFFKGSLAKDTITKGLVNHVDEWIIYETVEVEENIAQVSDLIESKENCSVIFTSPSTVNVFHQHIGHRTGYETLTICAIGHITKEYLESLGVAVHVMPKTYILTEIIHALAEWKGREL